MGAFLYLNLNDPDHFSGYQQPEVQLVKTHFPGVAVLDLDAASDDMLMHYAKRLLLETEQVVVCIKTAEKSAPQLLMTMLETVLQSQQQQQLLVILQGDNARIQRILEARPQLKTERVHSVEDLLQKLKTFYR